MKNTVTLVGFVGNNPEVRTTQGGATITGISLATTRSFKDGEGNRQTETEWHRITCFNGVDMRRSGTPVFRDASV